MLESCAFCSLEPIAFSNRFNLRQFLQNSEVLELYFCFLNANSSNRLCLSLLKKLSCLQQAKKGRLDPNKTKMLF